MTLPAERPSVMASNNSASYSVVRAGVLLGGPVPIELMADTRYQYGLPCNRPVDEYLVAVEPVLATSVVQGPTPVLISIGISHRTGLVSSTGNEFSSLAPTAGYLR